MNKSKTKVTANRTAKHQRSTPKPPLIPGLRVCIQSETELGRHPDTLLIDDQDRLYLTFVVRHYEDKRRRLWIHTDSARTNTPLDEIEEGMLETSTPMEVLEWWCQCSEFMTSYDGEIADVIRLLLKEG